MNRLANIGLGSIILWLNEDDDQHQHHLQIAVGEIGGQFQASCHVFSSVCDGLFHPYGGDVFATHVQQLFEIVRLRTSCYRRGGEAGELHEKGVIVSIESSHTRDIVRI